jgi:demethylmenaquinone methyltransferase/2-methoxy-6-polyprenyl-1,4-benzoquinol methylase
VLALPVADGSFDAATIACGLRNLVDYEACFRELARAVRAGGRVVCLGGFVAATALVGPTLPQRLPARLTAAGAAVGERDAYRNLPASIDGFPDADRLASTMWPVGLVDMRYWRFGLGFVALHVGEEATSCGCRHRSIGGPLT